MAPHSRPRQSREQPDRGYGEPSRPAGGDRHQHAPLGHHVPTGFPLRYVPSGYPLQPPRAYVPQRHRDDHEASPHGDRETTRARSARGGGGGESRAPGLPPSSSDDGEPIEYDPLSPEEEARIDKWIDDHERYRAVPRHAVLDRYRRDDAHLPSNPDFVREAIHDERGGDDGEDPDLTQYRRTPAAGTRSRVEQMKYAPQPAARKRRRGRPSRTGSRSRSSRDDESDRDGRSLLTRIHDCGGYC